MKITYDKSADAVYFYLVPKKTAVTNTLQPNADELYFVDMHDNEPI